MQRHKKNELFITTLNEFKLLLFGSNCLTQKVFDLKSVGLKKCLTQKSLKSCHNRRSNDRIDTNRLDRISRNSR